MRKSHYLAVTAAAVGVVGIGGFGAAISIAAPGPLATVAKATPPPLKLAKVSVKSGSGAIKASVLVDAKGRAVYLLTGDKMSHAECASKACLGAWPAVTSSTAKPVLGPGVKGKLSVWRHAGVSQLVLGGHPLYTFVGDKGAGVANGEGLASDGGVWKVLSGNGAAAPIAVAPVSSGTSTTSTSAGTGSGAGMGSTSSNSPGGSSGTSGSGSSASSAGSSSAPASGSSGSGSSGAGGSGAGGSGSGASGAGSSGSGTSNPTPTGTTTPSTTTPPPTPSTTTPSTTTPSTTTPSTTTPSTTTSSPPVDDWA